MFCKRMRGADSCILCFDCRGVNLQIFNRPVTQTRFDAVRSKLRNFGWYPYFTNAEELRSKYGKGQWARTPAVAIRGRTDAEAYADMPQELEAYIRSMPEFDEAIFNAITGRT